MLTTLTIAHLPTARIGAALRAALAGILALHVTNVFRALKNRRDAALLSEFDDRMLADIGLSRSDVRDAYAQPLWRDPTALLNARAHEKRRYRRGAPFGLAEQEVAPSLVPEPGFYRPPTQRPARLSV